MRAAFLTMDDTGGWSIDADLAFEPLADLGWQAEWVPWRTPDARWDDYDAVYLAATWDYPEHADEFIRVLTAVDASSALLVNPLELVRWNIPKTYLAALEERGVPVVPSRWYDRWSECRLAADFDAFGTEAVIVKPVVSTNANNTFLLDRDAARDAETELAGAFARRAFLVQPFLGAVRTEGEYSVFLIGDGFSHGIRKVPKGGDFRVQEEHGAAIEPAELTPELVAVGTRAVDALPARPLYARCDFVRDDEGQLRVMELELIEPSLYLRMHDAAPARFAAAFDRWVRTHRQQRETD